MDDLNKISELTYSLTFNQRLLNPPQGFVLRLCGTVIFVISPLLILKMDEHRAMMLIILSIVILFFSRYLLETMMCIFERDHSRCIVVRPYHIGFGHRVPELWVLRKHLKVEKGIAGTHLIRIGNSWRYLVVTNSIITLSELKKMVELKETNIRCNDLPDELSK